MLIEIIEHVSGEPVPDAEGFERFDYYSMLKVKCGEGSDGSNTAIYTLTCDENGWVDLPTCKRKNFYFIHWSN